jgi:hypothetical protein
VELRTREPDLHFHCRWNTDTGEKLGVQEFKKLLQVLDEF